MNSSNVMYEPLPMAHPKEIWFKYSHLTRPAIAIIFGVSKATIDDWFDRRQPPEWAQRFAATLLEQWEKNGCPYRAKG